MRGAADECPPPPTARARRRSLRHTGLRGSCPARCRASSASIWEPACGTGSIVNVLRAAGHQVIATDLNDRGCPDSESRIDFLLHGPPVACDAIVTNPPYKLAAMFVESALERAPLVIMLLRWAFYESVGRSHLLDTGKLARVHLFKRRLPRMHREGWSGPKATSSIAFAWFCWEAGPTGPTTTDRIDWRDTYDVEDDFSGSINEAYAAIRARVAGGGPTWTPP